MRRVLETAVAVGLVIGPALRAVAGDPAPDSADFFETRVRPVLVEHCVDCHSGDEPESGLQLDSLAGLLRGGTRGPAIVPGEPGQSLLLSAINHGEILKMPPRRKLPQRVIGDLTAWVEAGARWPNAEAVSAVEPTANGAAEPRGFTDEERSFWSFQPPREPAIPAVRDAAWVRSPIDNFILARLEERSWTPAPPAEKRMLIRRGTFDLIGLPPTPAEVDAFLADESPQAFARVIDRLLARPQYGERWGRRWLDVARYADSNGLDENLAYANAYRYRDYVIAAFNRDLPYDQFVREQIAGDLLPAADDPAVNFERLTATGFLSLGAKMLAEDDPAKMQMDIIDEQVDVIGRAFVGLTLGCARCHDHKFDPIRTDDYYALAGIFKSTQTMENFRVVARWLERPLASEQEVREAQAHQQRIEAAKTELAAITERPGSQAPQSDSPPDTNLQAKRDALAELEKTRPELDYAMAVTDGTPEDVAVHIRGSHLTLGRKVPRGFPRLLAGDNQPAIADAGSGRLRLAEWITAADHPLTARVMVNRIWLGHFGQGLVRSPDNFGRLGERPTHPELLDWLALRFVESGSSIKAMHRLIMQSSTYQMGTGFRAEYDAVDPENRLYWRRDRQRLEAEAIRDAILAVVGTLDLSPGGTLLKTDNRAYVTSTANKNPVTYDSHRRSVYLPVVRSALYDMFQAFDFPDPSVSGGKRETTTIAPQALFMMNSQLVAAETLNLATALVKDVSLDDSARIARLYLLCYSRPPSEMDTQRALEYVDRYAAARGAARDPRVSRLRAWQSLVRALMAANEFVYIE